MRSSAVFSPIFFLLSASLVCGAEPPAQPWWPQAPPLPAPSGQVLPVSNVEQLFQAAQDIQPGGTILVADGHYMMPRYFELRTDRVTLRSASGKRDRVILDGASSMHGELVGISNCRDVTIADLTIQNIKFNGFKINSNKYATHITIRNCVIHNIWQRGVKGPAVDKKDREKFWPTECRIEYCLFYNDRPKQFSDDPTDTSETFGGNYIGGIDAMFARQWVIADNVFVGIHGRTGEGRGAVFLWNESRECVVERNIIVDCDVGICLGNHYRHADARWHDLGCIVRNNLVTRCPETGILAAHTRDCQIIHNTVHDPESRLQRLVWALDDNDGLVVANNLLSGPGVRDTGTSKIANRDNPAHKNLAESFVDAETGNLRLNRAVIGVKQLTRQAPLDIDGHSRPERPMPGAHQYGAPKAADTPTGMRQRASTELERPPWVGAMRRVHAGFRGTRGYVAQFGDSITYSMAFWSPMGWTNPEQYLTQDDGLPKKPPQARWRDILLGTRDKGPKFANYSGWRVGQILKSMDAVLDRERPEVAIIMVGTNDISGGQVPKTYATQLAEVIDKCTQAHCVPLLSTIPPRRGHDAAVAEANQIIRDLAKRKQVPLVDFHAECLRRRPGSSWDGTLISQDGVHPSGGETHVFTDANLKTCGYALRNWITFLMVRQIYFRVLQSSDSPTGESAQHPSQKARQVRATLAVWNPVRPAGSAWTVACSPRILSSDVADAYSMRTFGQFDRWRDLPSDARAYEVYRYLVDKRTGLFHMNVVAEGDDGLSEFVQIRDPVKIINVYGYAYCGILGPTMAGVCEGIELGPARTLVLPGWNHVAAETFYDGSWHYLDLDVRAVFRRPDGTLASMKEAQQDASLWRDRGPLFFPNDPLDSTRETYRKTAVQTFHAFHQTGHTMDYVLRPGERFTRWWQPQGERWHHLGLYNDMPWLRQLIESPPRGPKPNHRHFTVHNYGNGQLLYEPQLTDNFSDFESGVYDHANLKVTADGLKLQDDGTGWAVFEVRSPYVIVPNVGELDRTNDDCDASVVEMNGRGIALSISLDNGLTWLPVPDDEKTNGNSKLVDLTRWVSGRYSYLAKFTLNGSADEATLRRIRFTTWVQVAPASLPALRQGHNQMKLVTGDHYGMQTQVVEVRSRASRANELLKYLVDPPRDYDPQRKTERIRGTITAQVTPPPGTKIVWFTATGQFRTHQRASAAKTKNRMAYAIGEPKNFQHMYEADVPTYANHWNYNVGREIVLDSPAESLYVRYTGDPAVNNFAIYAHCRPDRPHAQPAMNVTHVWNEDGQRKQASVKLNMAGEYEVTVEGEPTNESIQIAVESLPR